MKILKKLGVPINNMTKYHFKKATGNGQSQCQKCGCIAWDCFMYETKEYNGRRVCSDCKAYMENGDENLIKIKWEGFKPKD